MTTLGDFTSFKMTDGPGSTVGNVFVGTLHDRFPEAFNADRFALEEVSRLVKVHGIRTIVETGTFEGKTTEALAEIVSFVATCEIRSDFNCKSDARLGDKKNVSRYFGNSAELIEKLLRPGEQRAGFRLGKDDYPILLFLDAHWGPHSPLLEELKAIADAGIKPVIVIHDFFNPDHPEFGWDSYDIGPYKWETIAESIHKIYGDKFACHYNDQAVGSMRGIVYIEPKE